MPGKQTVEKPGQKDGLSDSRDSLAQVVLYNDDHTDAGFVVGCLIRIFSHPSPLAAKIMIEAHVRGRAIAEVEGIEEAKVHCSQLQAAGLGANVESL